MTTAGSGPSKWQSLTQEEQAVMEKAIIEGDLIEVMSRWRAAQRWRETGTTTVGSDLTDQDKVRLVPRFSEAVNRLVDAGWLTVTEWVDDVPSSLSGDNLQQALDDPRSWVWDIDLDFRVIRLVTTDAWDLWIKDRHQPG